MERNIRLGLFIGYVRLLGVKMTTVLCCTTGDIICQPILPMNILYFGISVFFYFCHICCSCVSNCILQKWWCWDEPTSLSCLELCKPLSWAAFVSLE